MDADEVRVLADGLLDPAPAGVADDVEHRREALVHADRAHVARRCAAAIRSMSSGSNVAPHETGTGYAVAPHAAKPARHSSCAMAGMPWAPSATIRCWVRISDSAPRAGSTGAVPNGRVSCPSPAGSSASRSTASSTNSFWCGATSPPSVAAPTQTP